VSAGGGKEQQEIMMVQFASGFFFHLFWGQVEMIG